MPLPFQSLLPRSLACMLVGMALGRLFVSQSDHPAETAGNNPSPADSPHNEAETAQTDTPTPVISTPALVSFADLPKPQQLDTLVRISKQARDTSSHQLLLARLANDLPTENLEELLAGLTERIKVPQYIAEKDCGAIALLAERLASRDPQQAIALGLRCKDSCIVQAGLNELLSRDAAEAFRAKAALPKDRTSLLLFFPACQSGLVAPGGSFHEAVRAIRSDPGLLENVAAANSWDLPQTLGSLAAKAASSDPAQALAAVRASAAEFVQSNPKRNPAATELELAKQSDALIKRIAANTVDSLRFESAAAASVLFDALKDTEKFSVHFAVEAAARFKHAGSEAAIAFAESQASKESMVSAASGVWWALAQKDRRAALTWIESLPAGAFRDGIFQSIRMHAYNRNFARDDTEVALGAASSLLSRRSQIDYYAATLSSLPLELDPGFGWRNGRSRAELIDTLPLTAREKGELESRVAPIPPR